MKWFNKDNLGKPWVYYTLATCSAVVLFVFLTNLDFWGSVLVKIGSFVYPVFLGAIYAMVLNPIVKFFSNRVFNGVKKDGVRKALSIVVTIAVLLLFLVFVAVAIVPAIANSAVTLAGNFDTYIKDMENFLNTMAQSELAQQFDLGGLLDSSENMLSSIGSFIPQSINSIINTSISFTKGLVEAGLGLILAVYFLFSKDSIKSGFKFLLQALLPKNTYNSTKEFLVTCYNIFIKYIGCDVLDGIIVGVANWIFTAVAHIPYGALLSVIAGLTNLIPTFGPVIGCGIGCFILVLVDYRYAMAFLVFTIFIQTIDAYIIKPKLFGDQLGLSPVVVMISVIVFGRICGATGVLLSVPIAAIINYIYQRWLADRLRKKQAKHMGGGTPDNKL